MPEIPCQRWLVSKSLFTRGIYLFVSRCKLLFWAMYEWKACSDFFLIGNALQVLTCTQQYLSMPQVAVCTTIGYKNHMLACLRSSMFSWSLLFWFMYQILIHGFVVLACNLAKWNWIWYNWNYLWMKQFESVWGYIMCPPFPPPPARMSASVFVFFFLSYKD